MDPTPWIRHQNLYWWTLVYSAYDDCSLCSVHDFFRHWAWHKILNFRSDDGHLVHFRDHSKFLYRLLFQGVTCDEFESNCVQLCKGLSLARLFEQLSYFFYKLAKFIISKSKSYDRSLVCQVSENDSSHKILKIAETAEICSNKQDFKYLRSVLGEWDGAFNYEISEDLHGDYIFGTLDCLYYV